MATTAQVETVATKERAYRIRRQKNSHRYPVTAPTDILESADIEHRQSVGMGLTIDSDGRVHLRYSGDVEAPLTLSAAHYDNTGELRVPSAIGAVLNLGDEEVTWSVEDTGSTLVIDGETTRVLDEFDMASAEVLTADSLGHITQDIDSEEHGSWSQEQFRFYLNTEMLSPLGWTTNQRVELTVMHRDGSVVFVFAPTENTENYSTQTASETGESQVDATLNIPNSVVRGFGVIDTEFMWSASDSMLVSSPKSNWTATL